MTESVIQEAKDMVKKTYYTITDQCHHCTDLATDNMEALKIISELLLIAEGKEMQNIMHKEFITLLTKIIRGELPSCILNGYGDIVDTSISPNLDTPKEINKQLGKDDE